jgi:hypothetical protein
MHQCSVGFPVGLEFGVWRRALEQANTASLISRSQTFVSSRIWLQVSTMSSADTGIVGSPAYPLSLVI